MPTKKKTKKKSAKRGKLTTRIVTKPLAIHTPTVAPGGGAVIDFTNA